MTRLEVKPISVNKCYRGKRYKTPLYDQFEADMMKLLPRGLQVPEKAKLTLKLGFSNSRSDIDNPVKIIMDILQTAYGFNDSAIYRLEVDKIIVKKGEEFIDFQLTDLSP